jgi:hypothetical protein
VRRRAAHPLPYRCLLLAIGPNQHLAIDNKVRHISFSPSWDRAEEHLLLNLKAVAEPTRVLGEDRDRFDSKQTM